ncbi:MAG: hypothetical protein MUF30_04480 [Burkholderiales bacterium]|nr:hypothetical protein [Burkholderiales bacterium]
MTRARSACAIGACGFLPRQRLRAGGALPYLQAMSFQHTPLATLRATPAPVAHAAGLLPLTGLLLRVRAH